MADDANKEDRVEFLDRIKTCSSNIHQSCTKHFLTHNDYFRFTSNKPEASAGAKPGVSGKRGITKQCIRW